MCAADFDKRPIASQPGHWVLARAGKRVLRPGGLGLTRELLARCELPGPDVGELAPGLGRTAREIIAARPNSYTGIELDPRAVEQVSEVVRPAGGSCKQADASDTGLADGSADVVVGEAMLTMQSPRAKAAIISEAVRVLRPGGSYAIHELGLAPDGIDPEVGAEISKELARAINVNARPLTVSSWSQLLEEHGLSVSWSQTAAMALLDMRRNLADEGVLGVGRIAWNVLTQPELRRRVMAMRKVFQKHRQALCGVAIVARKPQ